MSAQRERDRFLDVVRALALARVVLWHTWSAAWLTWFPAMPAMFFATGALLDDSVERRGWRRTVRQRARRLLVPFWVYGAVSVTVMVVGGWRPAPAELLGWVLPVVDPVGSAELRGLWIPLWYVRAYVWFVLAAGVLRRLVRLLGVGAPVLFACSTVAASTVEHLAGRDVVPLSVIEAVAYGTFVTAGMVYASRGRVLPARRTAVLAAVAAGVVAVADVWRFGPDDLVVNRSVVLTVLVGVVGLMVLFACRPVLAQVRGALGRMVDLMMRRTLTIYLWHGFGLVAAAQLVDAHVGPAPLRWMLSLLVVVTVTFGCVVVFGWVEDLAAGRGPEWVRSAAGRRSPETTSVVAGRDEVADVGDADAFAGAAAAGAGIGPISSASAPSAPGGVEPAPGRVGAPRSSGSRALVVVRVAAVPMAVLLVGASLLGSPGGRRTAEPLSGRAVVGRAGLVDATTTTTTPPEPGSVRTPSTDIESWLERHPHLRTDGGLSSLRGSLIEADGTVHDLTWTDGAPVEDRVLGAAPGGSSDAPPLPWWSMTKTATVAWLMRAVESGVVHLDDPLERWVPEAPHADRMTLEQLARHRAGIPRTVDDGLFETTPVGVLRRWERDGRLAFDPGTGFEYSRAGYVLLALALERATGSTWRAAIEDMASRAGVGLTFDEDVETLPEVTDPDGHGYRGRSWSSGAIVSEPAAMAQFYRWVFGEGLTAASIAAMSDFLGEDGEWIYGLGLMPLCPCTRDEGRVRTQRVGLDSMSGSFAVDLDSGAAVVLFPDRWFDADTPRPEFYELESVLLDLAGTTTS